MTTAKDKSLLFLTFLVVVAGILHLDCRMDKIEKRFESPPVTKEESK